MKKLILSLHNDTMYKLTTPLVIWCMKLYICSLYRPLPSKEDEDERSANYERYRCLVENEAAGCESVTFILMQDVFVDYH